MAPSADPSAVDDGKTIEQLREELFELRVEKDASGCCPFNSAGDMDIYNRKFSLPVDAEHKATAINVFSNRKPHMRAFHTSWFNFFSGFVSTFAAAPLGAYMKKTDSLNLTKQDIAGGKIASVSGTIVLRAIMGPVMDVFGARKGMFVLMAVCTPGVIGMMFTTNAAGFIICRCLIGFSLATFVCSQTWCAQMFSRRIIGVANATAAGWGNLGGGVTNLLMPYFFLAFMEATGKDEDLSWRLAYLIPLACHIGSMILSWSSQDLPDGNYKELENSGVKQKSKGSAVLKIGLSNVNAWILTLTYGACFGVELTMNNQAAGYFTEYHGLSPGYSGIFASCFGLMNICMRSLGGILSDVSNKKWGMRGRLWSTWLIQTLEGVVCIILGFVTAGMDSPFDYEDDSSTGCGKSTYDEATKEYTSENPNCIQGWTKSACGEWSPVAEIKTKVDGKFVNKSPFIPFCGSLSALPSDRAQTEQNLEDKLMMILTPPQMMDVNGIQRDGSECISNKNMAGGCLAIMILFSIFVQAAEGLHYGVVPYVSRPALGVVSGMVGAGGSLGSVLALAIFFSGAFRVDLGLAYMGIYIVAVTLLLFFVYFPDMGSMLTGPGVCKYDPQIIKPPAGYLGADVLNMEGLKKAEGDAEAEAAPRDVQLTAEK
jgi:NNP family nitrate/nitrite transporter-like MFS transporter